MDKIILFIDTNKLGNFKQGGFVFDNFNDLNVNKDVLNLLTSLANVDVAISQIVFDELIYEQRSQFNEHKEKMGNLFSRMNLLPNFKFETVELDYIAYLNQRKLEFIKKFEIVELPYPVLDMNHVIKKSLEKSAPFGKKNKADAGIKDEIIWTSIMEFVKIKKYPHYIFYTQDDDFNDASLQVEFKKITGKELKRVDGSIGDLKVEIDNIQSKNNIMSKIADGIKINKGEILSLLNSLPTYVSKEPVNFKINKWLDFELIGIEGKEESYQAIIECEVENDTPYTGYGIVDEIYSYYESEKSYVRITLVIEVGSIISLTSDQVMFYSYRKLNLFSSKKIELLH